MARQHRGGGVGDRYPVDRSIDEAGCGVVQAGIGGAVDLGLGIGGDCQSRRGDRECADREADRVIAVGGERSLGNRIAAGLLAGQRA